MTKLPAAVVFVSDYLRAGQFSTTTMEATAGPTRASAAAAVPRPQSPRLTKSIISKKRPKAAIAAATTATNISTNINTHSFLAMFLWPIISGLLFSNAQYSSPLLAPQTGSSSSYCDSSRLSRCQQDIVKDMQLVGLNAASVQYPINQGPPYSPAAKLREQQQRLAAPATCRLVRSNLDCMLITTPICYENGLQLASQTGDLALRAKRFLEQYNCNEPDTTWQATFCYRSPEIRSCEERYGFTAFSSASMLVNSTACLAYQAFKYCVEAHLRLNCKVHEIDMANEYLIDRAGDLAWRCPANSTANLLYGTGAQNPYALNNQIGGKLLSPNPYGGSQYEQRPLPTYVGSSNGVTLFSNPVREQAWERFRSSYDDTRFGISRLPTGSGDVFGK
jgi:hypothetical protein